MAITSMVCSWSWKDEQIAGLELTIESIKALPMLDRFGLTNVKVTAQIGQSMGTSQTYTLINASDVSVNETFWLPCELLPGGEVPSLTMSLLLVDSEVLVRQIVKQCKMTRLREGETIKVGGSGFDAHNPRKTFIISSQASVLLGPDASGSPTKMLKNLKRRDKSKLFKELHLSKGSSIGAHDVLLPNSPPSPPQLLIAIEPFTLLLVPRAAIFGAIRARSQLAKHLALHLARAEEVDMAAGEGDANSLTVVVHVYSARQLPAWANLQREQSDLRCFVRVEDAALKTASLRFSRQSGEMPFWDERFVFESLSGSSGAVEISILDLLLDIRDWKSHLGSVSIPISTLKQYRTYTGSIRLHRSGGDLLVLGEDLQAEEGGGASKRRLEESELLVHMSLQGGYYAGERELISALRSVSCESSFYLLRQMGVRNIEDLLLDLDLSSLQAGMPRKRFELLSQRLQEGRRGGFLSRSEMSIAETLEEASREEDD
uniref:C2 domain-containing protein n=1 Tax=Hanusia phi TaxID=3032 RepID=A0A7S0EWX9_9CRYP